MGIINVEGLGPVQIEGDKPTSQEESLIIDAFNSRKKEAIASPNKPRAAADNSPSITNHNLSLLDDYFTIGVNRIFFIYTPTILFWQDLEMWTKHKKDLLKCNSMRVCRNISDPQNIFVNFLLGQNPPRFPETPQVLYGRGNSGILIAQLAYAFGCSSVILLGMDCKYEKDKTNFYGKNKDHKTYTMKMCRNSMKWLKNNCPIPIYNCSNIDLWPFMTLEDAIRKSNPIPKGKKYFTNLFLTGKHKNESD